VTLEHEEKDSGVLLTLNRGLQVLEGIARQEGNATAKGLSDQFGIKIGTCYQILRTLQMSGYAERLPGGRYGLGTRLASLSGRFESNAAPPPAVLAVLRNLHATLDESVYISLRQGSKIVIAATMEGTRSVRVGPLHVGYSEYPHARATTKCFLAYTDPREFQSYLNRDNLEKLTPATITDWDELLEDFRITRERGFGMDVEEFTEGVGCISAVMVNSDSVAVGALGISMPVGRLNLRFDEAVAAAKEAGHRASEALGYQGSYPPVEKRKARPKKEPAAQLRTS
jgi:IclR family acetate operon transcriptional repressor